MDIIKIIAVTGKYPFHGPKYRKYDLFHEAQLDIIAWKNIDNEDFNYGNFRLRKPVNIHELRELQKEIKPNTIVILWVLLEENILNLISIDNNYIHDSRISELFPKQAKKSKIKIIKNETHNIAEKKEKIKYLCKKIIFNAYVEYTVQGLKEIKNGEDQVIFNVEKNATENEIESIAKGYLKILLNKIENDKEVNILRIEKLDDIEWHKRLSKQKTITSNYNNLLSREEKLLPGSPKMAHTLNGISYRSIAKWKT